MDVNLISEVENLPQSSVRMGYNQLSSQEKVVFWNRHIERFISSNTLSPELKTHIMKLKSFIKPELYETLGTPVTDKYVLEFTKGWYTDPVQKGIFKADVLGVAGTLMGAGKIENNVEKLRQKAFTSSTEENCDCYYSISCWGTYWCTTKDFCKDQGPYDCGITGTSRCTGTCNL